MSAERTLHLGDPVDAAWGDLPEATSVRRASDAEGGTDEEREADPDPARVVVRLRDDRDRDDRDASGPSGAGTANADLAVSDGTVALGRLRAVRDRYPDASVLAYSVRDRPDAAIDASRLGVEYVSGRRLAADGETLADRLAERGGTDGEAER